MRLINDNQKTPTVQLFELDNNLNQINLQEQFYQIEDDSYEQNYNRDQDNFDSNDEDNPNNEYPDESDEYDEHFKTRNENLNEEEEKYNFINLLRNKLKLFLFILVIAMKRLTSTNRNWIAPMIVHVTKTIKNSE